MKTKWENEIWQINILKRNLLTMCSKTIFFLIFFSCFLSFIRTFQNESQRFFKTILAFFNGSPSLCQLVILRCVSLSWFNLFTMKTIISNYLLCLSFVLLLSRIQKFFWIEMTTRRHWWPNFSTDFKSSTNLNVWLVPMFFVERNKTKNIENRNKNCFFCWKSF